MILQVVGKHGDEEGRRETSKAVHQAQTPDTTRAKERAPPQMAVKNSASPRDDDFSFQRVHLAHLFGAITIPRPKEEAPEDSQPGHDPNRNFPIEEEKQGAQKKRG